jgi:hypothetical protein
MRAGTLPSGGQAQGVLLKTLDQIPITPHFPPPILILKEFPS